MSENIEIPDEDELEKRGRVFLEDVDELRTALTEQYDDNWIEVTKNLSSAPASSISLGLQQNWGEKFMEKNKEMFIGYLSRLYFCPDKETYEKEVKTQKFKDKNKYLLPPQYQAYKQVEGWEDEKFADEDARKSYVEETVDELTEEPWGGQSVRDTAREFSDWYEKEVIED